MRLLDEYRRFLTQHKAWWITFLVLSGALCLGIFALIIGWGDAPMVYQLH